jgi:hypothetical protein
MTDYSLLIFGDVLGVHAKNVIDHILRIFAFIQLVDFLFNKALSVAVNIRR